MYKLVAINKHTELFCAIGCMQGKTARRAHDSHRELLAGFNVPRRRIQLHAFTIYH